MAVQLSVDVRNARLDAIEIAVGTQPYLDLRSGAQPGDCAAADLGTELLHLQLPSDWLNAASGGTKTKAGTWSGSASASGTGGHFRIKNAADTTCHMQGSVTGAGGGGDMELDNTAIANGQTVIVDTFTLTDGNA